jgi:capsular polysaccharide biosynthesis protein
MELNPMLPVVHLNLGVLMRTRGLLRQSEHFLLQAVMLFPDLFKAHLELAHLYLDEERDAEAAECLKSVVALRPDTTGAHFMLGMALSACGDTRAAIASHECALAQGHEGAALELTKLWFEMAWEVQATDAYRLAQPGSTRLLCVRETSLPRWCAAHEVALTRLGDVQVQPFDIRPPTLPEAFASAWRKGKAVVPFAYLAAVHDAEVLRPGFAVLTGRRELILEGVVSQYLHYPYRDGPVRFNTDDGRMLLELDGEPGDHAASAFLLGAGGDRYGWLYETLARLWFVEQDAQLRGMPLVVAAELAAEELEMLGEAYGGEPQLINIAPGKSLRVDTLVVSSLLALAHNVSPVAVQFLRRKFASKDRAAGPGRKLFLSRRACTSRHIANEEALKPLLEANGFELVDAAGMVWRERLALFEQADVIVGLDDDTMADLFIVRQGARVGVIATDGLQNSRAWLVSAQLGHRFCYLQGRPLFESNAQLDQCDVELDPALLKRFFSAL